MARASGSYPAGRWFKSDIRYHSRPVGQAVKTRPFHGCNMGSIPVRVTMEKRTPSMVSFFSWCSAQPRAQRTYNYSSLFRLACISALVRLLLRFRALGFAYRPRRYPAFCVGIPLPCAKAYGSAETYRTLAASRTGTPRECLSLLLSRLIG